MKTEVISGDDPKAISRALYHLKRGGIVAFPTDTVYGLAADAYNGQAIMRLYRAKGRSSQKAIPILLSDPSEIAKVAQEVPSMAQKFAACFWPGPLTIVVPKRSDLPPEVSATSTVGLRVPDHPIAQAVLSAAGPLAVTSANRSGEPNPCTVEEVLAGLRGRIELLIDGGVTPGGQPSTVVDCSREKPRILRAGPIGMGELLSALVP